MRHFSAGLYFLSHYPPNDGFAGAVERTTLKAGTVSQRTGSLYGSFVTSAGTPLQMLSLPYDKIAQPTTYYQLMQPVEVLKGIAAPWFGQMGGGTQYVLIGGNVQDLLNSGVLRVFGE